jgi:hypothetical protein
VQRSSKKPFAFVVTHPQRRHFFMYAASEAGAFFFVDFRSFVVVLVF